MIRLGIIWTVVLGITFCSVGCDSDSMVIPSPPSGRTDQAEKIADDTKGIPAWTPDGQNVIYIVGLCSPWCSIVSGPERTVIIPEDIGFRWPSSFALSPDGGVMAVSAEDSVRHGKDLFLVSLPDLEVVQFRRWGSRESRPSWAPDGSQLVYDAGYSGSRNIEVLTLVDNSQIALSDSTSDDIDPDWSPDGSRIAFASNRSGEWEIWTMANDGNQLLQLTSDGGVSPSWSPDGGRIAFEREERLWVMDANGDHEVRLSEDEGMTPVWSPSGDRIAFLTHYGYGGNGRSLWTLPVD